MHCRDYEYKLCTMLSPHYNQKLVDLGMAISHDMVSLISKLNKSRYLMSYLRSMPDILYALKKAICS